jgi:protein-tyrosine phosphatase
MTDSPTIGRPPLRILVVCTANRCRSPVAEVLLWRALTVRDVPAIVRSAGFLEAGWPVDETTRGVMLERGVDLRSHRSRTISSETLGDFDLILAMERRHARELVVMAGPGAPIHTMRGFASTARGVPPSGNVSAWIGEVTEARKDGAFNGDGCDDEIPDPVGRPRAVHLRSIEQIEQVCEEIAALIAAV